MKTIMLGQRAYVVKTIPCLGFMRALAIIVGIIAIIAAIIVLVYPAIAVATLVMLLAIGLLPIGIERLAIGTSGRPYRPVVHRKGVPA